MVAVVSKTPKYLESLNAEQREAAAYGSGDGPGWQSSPLLIIAGAGTGKTMTLAHRVAHQFARREVPIALVGGPASA